MSQRTIYALMGFALGGMALGIVLGVSGIDPASHWVFSASLLALLGLGVVWAVRAWHAPEDRRLLRLMALAVVGIVVGWIAGAAGTTTVGGVLTFGSLIALGGLAAAFAAKRRRAPRWTAHSKL